MSWGRGRTSSPRGPPRGHVGHDEPEGWGDEPEGCREQGGVVFADRDGVIRLCSGRSWASIGRELRQNSRDLSGSVWTFRLCQVFFASVEVDDGLQTLFLSSPAGGEEVDSRALSSIMFPIMIYQVVFASVDDGLQTLFLWSPAGGKEVDSRVMFVSSACFSGVFLFSKSVS